MYSFIHVQLHVVLALYVCDEIVAREIVASVSLTGAFR
jgi:hypothetical protein